MTKNINEVLKELKELQAMEAELKAEIDELKQEAIDYMTEAGVDEVVTDDAKATYRSVLSNRFDSTAFKRVHEDLYRAFTKVTECRRFTLN